MTGTLQNDGDIVPFPEIQYEAMHISRRMILDETMAAIWLIATIPLIVFLLWRILGRKVPRAAIVEKSGLSYFKVLLRQRGIDLSQIPDAALSEIIRKKTIAAKKQATIAGLNKSDRAARNWRIILVRSLEAEANLMQNKQTLRPAPNSTHTPQSSGTPHRSKSPEMSGMTAEQFLEATQRGTLYSELHERQSRRQTS